MGQRTSSTYEKCCIRKKKILKHLYNQNKHKRIHVFKALLCLSAAQNVWRNIFFGTLYKWTMQQFASKSAIKFVEIRDEFNLQFIIAIKSFFDFISFPSISMHLLIAIFIQNYSNPEQVYHSSCLWINNKIWKRYSLVCAMQTFINIKY